MSIAMLEIASCTKLACALFPPVASFGLFLAFTLIFVTLLWINQGLRLIGILLCFFLNVLGLYFIDLLNDLIIFGFKIRLCIVDTLFSLLNIALIKVCRNINKSLVQVSELRIEVRTWYVVDFFLTRMGFLISSAQVNLTSIAHNWSFRTLKN